MRIAFINGVFPQLSQTFVLNQIDFALERGEDVTIYCRRLQRRVVHPLIRKWRLYRKFIYSRPLDRAVLLRVSANAIRHPLRYLKAYALRMRRRITWDEFLLTMQLDRPPDLLLANFGPNGIVAAKVKQLFFPEAKLVVIFHGYDVSSYVLEHGWGPYRRMAPAVDLAICVNEVWAELLRENSGIEKVSVHHLGVPLEQVPAWRGNGADAFSLLFVGRMAEKKGFNYLLDAVLSLRDAGVKNFRLHAIGDGPLYNHYLERIREVGLDSHVVMYGARSHDFVLRLMAECDCLVAPSVTARDGDAEGIPVTLMEAMACGLPVVSTTHSGIPELVVDGRSGLLTPERDVLALEAALRQLMQDPALRRRLADEGRIRVEGAFDSVVQNPRLFEQISAA
jgi:colanic acid/amylovoran biosynthesis glycosyltransferase